MTASTDAVPRFAPAAIIRRYYLAMAVPFVIDLINLGAYAAMNGAPQLLASSVVLSAGFLLLGVGIGAYFLIRPIRRFIAGEVAYAEIEPSLSSLPRHSAAVTAICYAPMVALRLLARRLDI